MDKWTRNFIKDGPSQEFHEVLHLIQKRKSLRKWAEKHTSGGFGAVFGLSQAEELLSFQPVLANQLPRDELEQYRHVCAAAVLSQETRIPELYLLFRPWGFERMASYLEGLGSKSRWSWMLDDWHKGLQAVRDTHITELASLDEPSKLVLYQAARQSGRIPSSVVPAHRHIPVLQPASLSECVTYALEDMESTELAAFLKASGQKQVGSKDERIERILSSVTTEEIAQRLEVRPASYLQLGCSQNERNSWSRAITFLSNLSDAAVRLDFQYTQNLSRITQARVQGWGLRLNHLAACPVHTRNVFRHSQLHEIQPLAHPDCDADFSPMM